MKSDVALECRGVLCSLAIPGTLIIEKKYRKYREKQGIDVYASFVVGFDADDVTIFDRQFEFIVESGIVVASVGLLLALPRTPLYERLERDGRLKSFTDDGHRLWNNLLGTNIVPLGMTDEELLNGFQSLLVRLAADGVIADRILNKLNRFGAIPISFEQPALLTLTYLARFLLHGVLLGGPRRWYHIARSFRPTLRSPRLIPFVLMNWVQGLAIRAFVTEHARRLDQERRITMQVSPPTQRLENVLYSSARPS